VAHVPADVEANKHIQEGDLTQAANRQGQYLETNTPETLDGTAERG